jgi:hypothetical protein
MYVNIIKYMILKLHKIYISLKLNQNRMKKYEYIETNNIFFNKHERNWILSFSALRMPTRVARPQAKRGNSTSILFRPWGGAI